jgi:hypothetical protein
LESAAKPRSQRLVLLGLFQLLDTGGCPANRTLSTPAANQRRSVAPALAGYFDAALSELPRGALHVKDAPD